MYDINNKNKVRYITMVNYFLTYTIQKYIQL